MTESEIPEVEQVGAFAELCDRAESLDEILAAIFTPGGV